ncbi:hypothetical protein GWK36_09495 [Caldichromatium japonicum]|uniref:Uncharacterized protein n=1 Tax=Caldichromatium japonicum TaxID=2699430 RepID=A0A6G7VDZ0_9GAMM|nr:hypothetical protein [Caldichromatium japonicum]QIK38172.1 hypothetical protein GWK36_09495 [Caldichromatium japonicum]
MKYAIGKRSEVLEIVIGELAKAKSEGSEGAFVFLPEIGRVNVIFNAAQQNVQPTASGAGMRARIGRWLISLGQSLIQNGGG